MQVYGLYERCDQPTVGSGPPSWLLPQPDDGADTPLRGLDGCSADALLSALLGAGCAAEATKFALEALADGGAVGAEVQLRVLECQLRADPGVAEALLEMGALPAVEPCRAAALFGTNSMAY